MNGLYLGIGGNSGNRRAFLTKAKKLIGINIGVIKNESSIYQTAAWGKTDQQDFYNQAIFVLTNLPAQEVLLQCLKIEESIGRVRVEKWCSRIIDIDVLFYNNDIIKTKNLSVPHPHIQDRNFVLAPMQEIAPHYIHPVLRKKIFTLYHNSPDKLAVKKVFP